MPKRYSYRWHHLSVACFPQDTKIAPLPLRHHNHIAIHEIGNAREASTLANHIEAPADIVGLIHSQEIESGSPILSLVAVNSKNGGFSVLGFLQLE
jgi:hypothetical protein